MSKNTMTCQCGTELPDEHDPDAWESFEPGCRFCQMAAIHYGLDQLGEVTV